jgi:hypothetical protein
LRTYSLARIAAQIPLAPDLTVISYVHNETYQEHVLPGQWPEPSATRPSPSRDIRQPTFALVRAVVDAAPKTSSR